LALSQSGDFVRENIMYIRTTWTARSLTVEQANRMMATWGKLEASLAASPGSERVCWYINADGSGGVAVTKVTDADAAAALGLEQSLALSEFLSFDSKIVLDLDSAMPAIVAGMGHVNAK
jgi:hypothetical protein